MLEAAYLVVGLIASLLIIGAAVWRLYRGRLGRRRVLRREVERLVPDAPLEWFRERLGAPVFTGEQGGWRVHVWVDPVCYVQALTEGAGDQEGVVAFSVTSRSRRWNPFGDVRAEPWGVHGFLGARRWGYAEVFYFGNPGLYRYYVLSVNDAGYVDSRCDALVKVLVKARAVATGVLARRETFPITSAVQEQEYLAARTDAVPNTITVTRPHFDLESAAMSLPFGVDLDTVRQFPG